MPQKAKGVKKKSHNYITVGSDPEVGPHPGGRGRWKIHKSITGEMATSDIQPVGQVQ